MLPAETPIPRIPVGSWAELIIRWIQNNLNGFLDAIAHAGNQINDSLTDVLLVASPLVMVVIFALIAWVVKSWKLAVGTAITFLLIISMNQLENAMETLALVIVATATALIIAIPLGIWAARNRYVSAVVRPVLDLMQTMPAFVYLIPAVLFFSIGAVPGLFATLIFAMPPGVRMTELGIKQVDKETVEAGRAFGATDWEILTGIQLPLAIPTIMAGVNQGHGGRPVDRLPGDLPRSRHVGARRTEGEGVPALPHERDRAAILNGAISPPSSGSSARGGLASTSHRYTRKAHHADLSTDIQRGPRLPRSGERPRRLQWLALEGQEAHARLHLLLDRRRVHDSPH